MNDCNSAPRHDQAAIQSAAPSLGLEVSPVNVRDASDIERDVTAFAHSSLKILRLQKKSANDVPWRTPGTFCQKDEASDPISRL